MPRIRSFFRNRKARRGKLASPISRPTTAARKPYDRVVPFRAHDRTLKSGKTVRVKAHDKRVSEATYQKWQSMSQIKKEKGE